MKTPSWRSTVSRLRIVFLGVISVAALSCFEDPVKETLRIEFLPDGELLITATVDLKPESQLPQGPVRARIEEARDAILAGRDDWSRRFSAVTPRHERTAWEKSHGRLEKSQRSAVIEEADLQRSLADTSLSTLITHGSGWDELTIYAGSSRRASSRQRSEVVSYIERWSRELSVYFAAVGDLYAHLEQEPLRAEACLGSIIEDVLSNEQKKALPKPTDKESELIERVKEAMHEMEKVLVTDEEQAYSVNELSYLVYDPFPAQLFVRIPGRVVEVAGFEPATAGELKVRRAGLWDALESLEGRWLSPDPFTVRITNFRDNRPPIDLAAFVSRERRAGSPPAASAIRAALVGQLQPPPTLRARWSTEVVAPK